MTRLLAIHPVLAARDVATSIAFYRSLGFALLFADVEDAPTYAALARDGCEVHLQWADASQWEGPQDRPVIRWLVDDVDALFAEWRAAGLVDRPDEAPGPWRTPADTPWGTREFHLHDPAANGLQFYQPRR